MMGFKSFIVFFSCLLCLNLLIKANIHKSRNPYQPPTENVVPEFDKTKRGSTRAPEALRSLKFPVVLVVHSSCLSCSSPALLDYVKACFRDKRVTNLVCATDRKEYQEIERAIPDAQVLYMDEAIATTMQVNFSPQLFRYDKSGVLSHVQEKLNLNLEENLKEGEH